MQKNKLLHLFKGLSRKEIRAFGKYVHRANVEHKTQIIALYDYLKANIRDIQPMDFDKTKAFDKILPDTKGNRPVWRERILMSDLCLLLEDFLVWQELEQEPERYQTLLRSALRRRQLDNLFFKSLKQAKQQFHQKPKRDKDYHYHQYEIGENLYFHPHVDKYADTNALSQLRTASFHLDAFYLLTKLKHTCELLILRHIQGDTLPEELPIVALQLLQQDDLQPDPLVRIYVLAMQLLQSPDATKYAQLKTLIFDHLPLNYPAEQRYLVVLLINIASLSLPAEHRASEMLELYKLGLEHQVLLDDGYFGADHFNNIIAIGCALQEFDWVQQFINDYVGYLDNRQDLRSTIKKLFDAQLLFGQQQYTAVIKKLKKLHFEDFTYGLRAHTLLLRSWYEVHRADASPELDVLCDSYRGYLHRKYREHAISAAIRDSNLRFIRILRRLPHCSTSRYARYTKTAVRTEIERQGDMVFRSWLIAKVEEL